MLTCGWIWMYAGAGLMLLELATPGFVMFFFGLSAASVGLVRLALGEVFSPTWQAVAFSAFAIFYLVFLRSRLKAVFSGDAEKSAMDLDNDLAGREGVVAAAIEPPAHGRVLVGDAEWDAEADVPLAAGTAVRVVARRNLTLRVEGCRV